MRAYLLVRVVIAFVSVFAVLVTGSSTCAALSAYEPFNYQNVGGDLNGQSGGGSFGFTNAWSGNTSFNISDGSLTSPVLPFPTIGNGMTTVAFGGNREISRILANPLGVDDTVSYISFLMRPEGILHQGAFAGWFGLSLRGDRQTNVVLSSFGDKYHLEVGGTTSQTNTNAVVGQTVLFVLRLDFTEGVDPVRLYINPQPGAAEPAIADASQINLDVDIINQVVLTGPGAYRFDELRIGTTFADVTPVPEPTSVLLCLAGIFATQLRLKRPRLTQIGKARRKRNGTGS